MTEKEYRALDIDSYSSIKVFLDDRKKYYRKFVLKEILKEEESDELVFGSLVDCLLFSPDDYEDRFALAVSQVPTGQYGKFVNSLWKISQDYMDITGKITKTMESMIEEAYNAVKYDKDGNIVDFKRDDLATVKLKFLGTSLEDYYKQLREAYGKTVIELSVLEKAQAVVQELKSNSVTREVINLVTNKRFTVYNQFSIIGEMVASITKSVKYRLKCLIDKLIIDHERKMIYIYDLKTAWDNEQQFQYNYFKYKYYIQAAVYFYLVVEWKKTVKEIAEYGVSFPRFIVAESANYKNPLIYTTNIDNFNQGMRGFMINGRYYPGVIKAVQDLIWHREVAIWSISRDNYNSNGVVKIKPFENED